MEGLVSETFTWTIYNFSELNTKMHYSDVFVVGADFKWRILMYPKGLKYSNHLYLSMLLEVADASTLPYGWSRHAQCNLTVVNQLDSNKSITHDIQHEIKEGESNWGFASFMPLIEFHDPSKGYLLNDTCVVEANVAVSKVGIKILDEDEVCTQPNGIGDPYVAKDHVEIPSTRVGELMDFRGFGRIEKAFVLLLEEVCLWHPSLVECQKKRSRMFTKCAFTALGRVLHFLKYTKVKDMTEDACEHLELLWEELETFKFDLAWLEPHVQSALSMKEFVERARQVKKLREDVDALESEMKSLSERVRLAVVVVHLETARRDLEKAEEGLDETGMESELGYGRH